MSTVLLVTSGGQQQGKSSTVSDLEVILSTLLILIELFLTELLVSKSHALDNCL